MSNPSIKILRIDSSARRDASETRALSDALIGRIETTANTTVTHRDLAVDAPSLVNDAWVGANFTDPSVIHQSRFLTNNENDTIGPYFQARTP